jgi:cold shock CspA family protein
MSAAHTGTVTAFDADVGWGEVTATDGTAFGFHCIAIVDGTRHIEVGAVVAFDLLPKLGRYEATALRPA